MTDIERAVRRVLTLRGIGGGIAAAISGGIAPNPQLEERAARRLGDLSGLDDRQRLGLVKGLAIACRNRRVPQQLRAAGAAFATIDSDLGVRLASLTNVDVRRAALVLDGFVSRLETGVDFTDLVTTLVEWDTGNHERDTQRRSRLVFDYYAAVNRRTKES